MPSVHYTIMRVFERAIGDKVRSQQEQPRQLTPGTGVPDTAERCEPVSPPLTGIGGRASATTTPAAEEVVQALDQGIDRLAKMHDWIDEDNEWVTLIDRVIRQQVATVTG